MSELVDQYKALTAELTRLEADAERVKGLREVVCGKLLAKDGKGHAYDLGDGMPMVISTTKVGTHYMAPKNKWQKSGRAPKPPKPPRVPKAAKEKAPPKPAVKRAIVNGKIVEIPVGPKSDRPPAIPVETPPVRVIEVEAVLVSKGGASADDLQLAPALTRSEKDDLITEAVGDALATEDEAPVVTLPEPQPGMEVTVKAGVEPVVVEATKVEIVVVPEPASEPEPPKKVTKPAKAAPQKTEPDPEVDELEAALAALDIE